MDSLFQSSKEQDQASADFVYMHKPRKEPLRTASRLSDLTKFLRDCCDAATEIHEGLTEEGRGVPPKVRNSQRPEGHRCRPSSDRVKHLRSREEDHDPLR